MFTTLRGGGVLVSAWLVPPKVGNRSEANEGETSTDDSEHKTAGLS